MEVFLILWYTGALACLWVCYMKGKLTMGLIGLFLCSPVTVVGACRIAKPGSDWARKQYLPGSVKDELSKLRFPAEAKALANLEASPTPELPPPLDSAA
jgi:hypothetical protein